MTVGRLSKPNGIGGVLAEARREARLSQREVGRRVGRRQKWVSDIEAGHAYCRFDAFIILARTVGADPLKLCARYLALLTSGEHVAREHWGGAPHP